MGEEESGWGTVWGEEGSRERERERKVGPTGRRLHDGIKSFVGINDNDDNEAACHRRVGRAIIVRRRISQSLLGNLFFATMFPFFSSDRQTISSSSSFFLSRKFRRKKKRKVSKDRRVSFLYKYFQGNFIPWFYALASDNAPRFEVWNDKFSSKFPQRERERERVRVPIAYEIAIGQLFVSRVAQKPSKLWGRTSQRTMQICFEGIASFVKRRTARPTFKPPFFNRFVS